MPAGERQLRDSAASSGVLAEQYFLTLLWKGESVRADAFALQMLTRSSDAGKAQWQERRGDAAFISGDIRQARALYDTSLEGHAHPASVWLKLSDVCFRLGDLEKERAFRQRVYGALRER